MSHRPPRDEGLWHPLIKAVELQRIQCADHSATGVERGCKFAPLDAKGDPASDASNRKGGRAVDGTGLENRQGSQGSSWVRIPPLPPLCGNILLFINGLLNLLLSSPYPSPYPCPRSNGRVIEALARRALLDTGSPRVTSSKVVAITRQVLESTTGRSK